MSTSWKTKNSEFRPVILQNFSPFGFVCNFVLIRFRAGFFFIPFLFGILRILCPSQGITSRGTWCLLMIFIFITWLTTGQSLYHTIPILRVVTAKWFVGSLCKYPVPQTPPTVFDNIKLKLSCLASWEQAVLLNRQPRGQGASNWTFLSHGSPFPHRLLGSRDSEGARWLCCWCWTLCSTLHRAWNDAFLEAEREPGIMSQGDT